MWNETEKTAWNNEFCENLKEKHKDPRTNFANSFIGMEQFVVSE